MKYISLLLLVVTVVHASENYVPKKRPDAASSFRGCLTKLNISRETFEKTQWDLRIENDLNRSMVKCMVTDFGLFDETKGFNMDNMVKQFGGDAVQTRVEKCVDNNTNGDKTDVWVQRVMNCLEDDQLKLYTE